LTVNVRQAPNPVTTMLEEEHKESGPEDNNAGREENGR
jgi:hypothetical protein